VTIREVLKGAESIELQRGERHALDGLLRHYKAKDAKDQASMASEFADLLTDSDPRVRDGAVVFFSKTNTADEHEALLDAWKHLELYEGVQESWYPDGRDLRDLLGGALSRRTVRGEREDLLDAMKAEALVPGRGQNVLSGLIPADPDWVRANFVEVVRRSPEALAGLLMWLSMLGVQPEAVIGPALGHVPDQTIKSAVALALPNDKDRLFAEYFDA
jgi:hypothetical protein